MENIKNNIQDNDDEFDAIDSDDYQGLSLFTASPETDLLNGVLGLCGESGEIADHIKKHLYHGHELDRDHLIEELGDAFWYVYLICTKLNISAKEVMRLNLKKLKKRYPEGFSSERSINRGDT